MIWASINYQMFACLYSVLNHQYFGLLFIYVNHIQQCILILFKLHPFSHYFDSFQTVVFIRYSLTVCFIIYKWELLLSKYTLNIDLRVISISLKCTTLPKLYLIIKWLIFLFIFLETKCIFNQRAQIPTFNIFHCIGWWM